MRNNNKICFISCVNDECYYEECLRYIKALHVPNGFVVEIQAIRGARSIAEGYNRAMKNTDAKYKVYIHQDSFIVNKDFIYLIIELFENEKIGLIGAAGSSSIPTNGIWWESQENYLNIFENSTGYIGQLGPYQKEAGYAPEVVSLDGLIMITQYDIEWREDLFTGWHFYDVSQSLEFKKAGYDVRILNSEIPWVFHDCGTISIIEDETYHTYRKVFLENYPQELFSL